MRYCNSLQLVQKIKDYETYVDLFRNGPNIKANINIKAKSNFIFALQC